MCLHIKHSYFMPGDLLSHRDQYGITAKITLASYRLYDCQKWTWSKYDYDFLKLHKLFIGEYPAVMIMTQGRFSVFRSSGAETHCWFKLWSDIQKIYCIVQAYWVKSVAKEKKMTGDTLSWYNTGGLQRMKRSSWCLAKSMWYTRWRGRKVGDIFWQVLAVMSMIKTFHRKDHGSLRIFVQWNNQNYDKQIKNN